jgi:transcriptional regulator with XRE-family HTH domain
MKTKNRKKKINPLKEYRVLRELTQAELAKKLKCTHSAISKIERGEVKLPMPGLRKRMIKLTGYDPWEI